MLERINGCYSVNNTAVPRTTMPPVDGISTVNRLGRSILWVIVKDLSAPIAGLHSSLTILIAAVTMGSRTVTRRSAGLTRRSASLTILIAAVTIVLSNLTIFQSLATMLLSLLYLDIWLRTLRQTGDRIVTQILLYEVHRLESLSGLLLNDPFIPVVYWSWGDR